MERTVKVGKMPGRINEVLVSEETTIGQAIELAGLEATGYDIKVDGVVKSESDLVEDANLIVLAQRVKGN